MPEAAHGVCGLRWSTGLRLLSCRSCDETNKPELFQGVIPSMAGRDEAMPCDPPLPEPREEVLPREALPIPSLSWYTWAFRENRNAHFFESLLIVSSS